MSLIAILLIAVAFFVAFQLTRAATSPKFATFRRNFKTFGQLEAQASSFGDNAAASKSWLAHLVVGTRHQKTYNRRYPNG